MDRALDPPAVTSSLDGPRSRGLAGVLELDELAREAVGFGALHAKLCLGWSYDRRG